MGWLRDIFLIIFGLIIIAFHDFATKWTAEQQKYWFGIQFTDWDYKVSNMISILIGLIFLVVGILSVLGYIKWK